MNTSRRSFFTRLAGWTAALGLGVRSAKAQPVTVHKPSVLSLDNVRDTLKEAAVKLSPDFQKFEVRITACDGVNEIDFCRYTDGDNYGTSETWGLCDAGGLAIHKTATPLE